ncbi:uncharacterized protein LOC143041535 [Oratosquilla oratoria]|uniref:uncharacterized protein LOC143041535 n=1 Tax=Oratosquilla oratoria TaxID=337810 RepID=UPI003F76FE04
MTLFLPYGQAHLWKGTLLVLEIEKVDTCGHDSLFTIRSSTLVGRIFILFYDRESPGKANDSETVKNPNHSYALVASITVLFMNEAIGRRTVSTLLFSIPRLQFLLRPANSVTASGSTTPYGSATAFRYTPIVSATILLFYHITGSTTPVVLLQCLFYHTIRFYQSNWFILRNTNNTGSIAITRLLLYVPSPSVTSSPSPVPCVAKSQCDFKKTGTGEWAPTADWVIGLGVRRRWEFLRKAVRRAVVYAIPDGCRVAVVVFNAKARTVAPLSKMESDSDLRERVGSSLPRNPSSVRESQACLVCGLREALSALGAFHDSEEEDYSAGATVVMVTAAGHHRQRHHEEEEEARLLVRKYGLQLMLVLYPLSERPGVPIPNHGLEPLATTSGGRVFTVMDEGVGKDSKISMLMSLMDAMSGAVKAGGAQTTELVHSESFPGGIASDSKGSFSLDDSLSSHARFAVYYYDLNHVGNAIHLTAPSGATFTSVNMQEEDGDVNMIFVNLNQAERGVWYYMVENRADSHQGLHVQVTSLPNPTKEPITVRVWTSQERDEIETSSALHESDYYRADDEGLAGGTTLRLKAKGMATPIVVYGEVKQGNNAVLGAKVTIALQRLGTNHTGGTYDPVHLRLFDHGTGDPDITRGDGVYSRYVPPLQGPGRYSLILSVDASIATVARVPDLRHHKHLTFGKSYGYGSTEEERLWASPSCCGSIIPYAHTQPSPPFTRQITGPTIFVSSAYARLRTHSVDNIPPARILDLVSWVNTSNGNVVLEWTAVGGDRDWGQAAEYEGVVTGSRREAGQSCAGRSLRRLPTPGRPGTRERATVVVKWTRKVLYLCIRAIDTAGNRGQPSNVAPAFVPRPPATNQVTTRSRWPGGSGLHSGLGGAYGNGVSLRSLEGLAVILGAIGGILLVVVLLAVYCYCLPAALRRKRNRQDPTAANDPEKDGRTGNESEDNAGGVAETTTTTGGTADDPAVAAAVGGGPGVGGGGGGAGGLVNGGSAVAKSTSRGSILAKSLSQSSVSSPRPTLKEALSMDYEDDDPAEDPDLRRAGEELYSSNDTQLNSTESTKLTADNTEEALRSRSLSIPDITKVDEGHFKDKNPEVLDPAPPTYSSTLSLRYQDPKDFELNAPNLPPPYYATLGRNRRQPRSYQYQHTNGHLYYRSPSEMQMDSLDSTYHSNLYSNGHSASQSYLARDYSTLQSGLRGGLRSSGMHNAPRLEEPLASYILSRIRNPSSSATPPSSSVVTPLSHLNGRGPTSATSIAVSDLKRRSLSHV